jgi:hypothetical protein
MIQQIGKLRNTPSWSRTVWKSRVCATEFHPIWSNSQPCQMSPTLSSDLDGPKAQTNDMSNKCS